MPVPETGDGSPDGPAPDTPEEPAPQQPGDTSGLAPGAPVVLGSVLV